MFKLGECKNMCLGETECLNLESCSTWIRCLNLESMFKFGVDVQNAKICAIGETECLNLESCSTWSRCLNLESMFNLELMFNFESMFKLCLLKCSKAPSHTKIINFAIFPFYYQGSI